MKPAPKIDVSFRDLSIWANIKAGGLFSCKSYNKLILKGIDGDFQAGTSTAILGPSGSGKTTLLNFLAARMRTKGMHVKGGLYVNGRNISSIKELKHRFAYVMQDDILFSELTVKEQLSYTARLAGINNPDQAVDDVMNWLNLKGCQDTRIGDEASRGISGGEKKRASIATEILTNPSVIFLDEPTTGLDSKSALDVAAMIKMFANNGRTVITTIHQPSSEILMKFDKILCICKGEIVYHGPPEHIPMHFANLGYPPSENTNPGDHLMTILNDDDIRIKAFVAGKSITNQEVKEKFGKRLDVFVSAYRTREKLIELNPMKDEEFKVLLENTRNPGFFMPRILVVSRFYKIYFRNPLNAIMSLLQFVVMVIINVVVYVDTTDYDETTTIAISDTNGLFYNFILLLAMSSITG